MEGVTLASILSNVGTILSSAVSWVGTVITTITGSPLLMLAALIPLVGYGVHMLKMLFSTKA